MKRATFSFQNSLFADTLLEKIRFMDPYAILFVIAITGIGLMTLFSAAGGHFSPWAYKQSMRFVFGFCLMICIALVDIRMWRTYSYPLYILSLLLLIFVEVKGRIGMGAQRWIDLGVFHLQASEVMKVTLIMALANAFHQKSPQELGRFRTYVLPLVLIALPSLLVLRQPDLGTVIILAATGAVLIFMAGIRVWKVMLSLVLGLGSLPLLWSHMHAYQKKRVMTFLNPEADPLGTGYHIMQSKIAIGSGGFFGKGFLKGTQGQLQFLPEKQTDFIFSHFTEEFGMLGGCILIMLYGCLFITLLKMCFEMKSAYGRLYGMGFQALLFFYVFINIGMVMGLLPVVGVPLPFMSYGGTSMISLLIGLGILLSAHIHRHLRFGESYDS